MFAWHYKCSCKWHSKFTSFILSLHKSLTKELFVIYSSRYSVCQSVCLQLLKILNNFTSSASYKSNSVCPRSIDQFYSVTYYIKWVKTLWTYSMKNIDYIQVLAFTIVYSKNKFFYAYFFIKHIFLKNKTIMLVKD